MCKGWLHITITDWYNIAFVNIGHVEDHVPYWKIDVPPGIIDFVDQNSKLTPTQLWDEILEIHPRPSFTRKVIYAMWAENNASEWKRDPDELKSANILLYEFSRSEPDPKTGKKPLYSVEPIPLAGEPGFIAIAFALPQILREVGGRVRELSLDSAWDTNGSRYEVYAFLGEFYGSGMPLGISPPPIITPRRSWRQRALYSTAASSFPTGPEDPTFVPLSQAQQLTPDQSYVASTALPHLKVRFQGIPVSTAPKEPCQAPSLTLRLNGVVRVIVPRQPRAENDGEAQPQADRPPAEDTDVNGEPGDLITDVERFLDNDNEEEEE
ncbi:hypothetical protein B0H14DRAFT_3867965 [Mycena olivaceomarginata]|nr:hypothetical protein B0H14DRAFT_3867965 [Mycena olivaceomarginata]